ncbi:hypothetical protein C8250_015470 [Streptomyces sp. So13.3]|uniref:hypothetical protein n=1 Tax=unclassified Streptomyces TaxID=2593676 RepID=UPI0013CA00D6|nr:hypothetical protein [Streptomyces sp. So13.3]NEA75444.1 hypothetical protein [Streptomyces sp. SID13588]QNA73127.1 hypothetical protein C8250_015470 [Streptomyces sp. So13.3]
MIIDPADDATTLTALAAACDTVRAQLPLDGPPYQDLDLVTVSRQLSSLGDLVTHLSDEVLFRSVQPGPSSSQRHRAIGAFASALDPLGRAISALGCVYPQIAFRDETSGWLDSPNLRDALRSADTVIEENLDTASEALRETADGLNAASTYLRVDTHRVQVALHRSTARSRATAPTPPPIFGTELPAASYTRRQGR